jgi:hypothetical protein
MKLRDRFTHRTKHHPQKARHLGFKILNVVLGKRTKYAFPGDTYTGPLLGERWSDQARFPSTTAGCPSQCWLPVHQEHRNRPNALRQSLRGGHSVLRLARRREVAYRDEECAELLRLL